MFAVNALEVAQEGWFGIDPGVAALVALAEDLARLTAPARMSAV